MHRTLGRSPLRMFSMLLLLTFIMPLVRFLRKAELTAHVRAWCDPVKQGVDDVGGGGVGGWEDREQMRREGEQEGRLLWNTEESTW